MTFDDAIKKAIQHYWDTEGDDTPNVSKVKKRKYTKDYFNNVATSTLPEEEAKKVSNKSPKVNTKVTVNNAPKP